MPAHFNDQLKSFINSNTGTTEMSCLICINVSVPLKLKRANEKDVGLMAKLHILWQDHPHWSHTLTVHVVHIRIKLLNIWSIYSCNNFVINRMNLYLLLPPFEFVLKQLRIEVHFVFCTLWTKFEFIFISYHCHFRICFERRLWEGLQSIKGMCFDNKRTWFYKD